MSKAKKIISIIAIGAICIGMASCAKNANENNETTSPPETTIVGTTQQATTEATTKKAEKEAKATTTTQKSDLLITEDEAIEAIKTMYSGYNVTKEKTKDNVVYLNVKDGNKLYSKIKVDLLTADATETVEGESDPTVFNLLA